MRVLQVIKSKSNLRTIFSLTYFDIAACFFRSEKLSQLVKFCTRTFKLIIAELTHWFDPTLGLRPFQININSLSNKVISQYFT